MKFQKFENQYVNLVKPYTTPRPSKFHISYPISRIMEIYQNCLKIINEKTQFIVKWREEIEIQRMKTKIQFLDFVEKSSEAWYFPL